MLSLGSILLGALLLFGGARPAAADTPCAGEALFAPPIAYTQAISDTFQPAANLFVCRVDGAGAPVDGSAAGTRSVTPAGFALLVLARWLHFVGYALGFGTICFGLWAAAALGEQPARLWRLVNAGILLLLSAEPLALLAQTIGVRGALLDPALAGDVLASGFGRVWAQRVGVALLLWVIAGVVKDGTASALWAAPALGLALAVIDGAAGAAGESGAARVTLAIIAATLHEAAMGAWFGGMALLLAQWGDLGEHQHAQGLARFGRLSGIAVGVLVVSGVALADLRLAQPADMFATLYGATLMLKLLLALAAIGLAAWPMYQRIWRWRAALAALVVVVGVAGLLVSLPPP